MSDSFADLWNSTGAATTKPSESSRKLGSLTPVVPPSLNAQNDVFSMLASAGTSSPASRTASNSANGARMTIAERAAQAERERQLQIRQQQAKAKQQASAWAGLDSLGEFTSRPSSTSQPAVSADSDWGFGLEATTASTSSGTANAAPVSQNDWGLDDFISQPAPSKPVAAPQTSSLLDLDEFTSPSTVQPQRYTPDVRSNTPGDFDFGDREDRLLSDHSDEDDILGELSKPVTERPAQPIVEMGFSIQQARVALAATDTGLDVQAALETLLSNGAASDSQPSERPREDQRNAQREPGWERYYESDEDQPRSTSSRRRTAPTSRSTAPNRASEPTARDGPSPSDDSQRHLQEQADKLIAQASEIGLSMFNRANAFWKEGKEKVQRAYEERAATAARTGEGGSRNGRPKWMQEVPEGEGGEGERTKADRNGFRDDDEVLPPKPSRPATQPRSKQTDARPPESQPSTSERAKVGNLFSDDPPVVYTSPFRRKAPARNPALTPAAPAKVTSSVRPTPPRAPSPIPLVQRKNVSASPAAITSSAQHKAKGTEMFKLGRYAEAETAYSAAISGLPSAHLLLIPLYNNRALARIKTGDHNGAIEDCTTVIELIGPEYHPAREAKVTKEDEGASVDLAEGMVKALWRRAEAYEGREKWDAARKDWEAVASVEWAGKARMEAVRGVGRCKQMLNADANGGAPSAPKSRPAAKPKPRPSRPPVAVPTEALNRVREANQAAEAEDQARHELKDVVDARLVAWKNGKETNIRALIASLETVLWPELGWQKVGMHELVTPAQVKIRYTKAIAKLHPDKARFQPLSRRVLTRRHLL
ncbi:hypothetical protein POSPLADRAFT_1184339 [Postia placenta MAD-698-R-SB12]|uniref:UBA domain-containing protein n=1 Tax=Postia placenta MAD-698-R-SB12 TaxID=670580 RepID=A0A1X6MT55_9APHY|nr:hypothetical protein POSPLADRAFT_1184339 [Postia placenta MAD-698-R-SB12]OSX59574.1 hypothetical protein POSPLADRAFT_1184339 [Postia placenta MAD-698-R-SB12]